MCTLLSLKGSIDVLLPEHVDRPLLELPSTYESYQALLEEFSGVMKEEQACFVVLLSMEYGNNLKWKLGMLSNEYFEICFLVFTIFISCITFSHYWYKAFLTQNTSYCWWHFLNSPKKKRIRSQVRKPFERNIKYASFKTTNSKLKFYQLISNITKTLSSKCKWS